MLALTLVFVFVAAFGFVVATIALLDRRRLAAAHAARSRLARKPGASDEETPLRLLRRAERLSSIRILDRLLADRAITRAARTAIVRSGRKIRVGRFLLIVAAATALGLVAGAQWLGAGAALVLGAFGAAMPWLVLGRLAASRRARFEVQLPEALDTIVNSLRAGYSFPAAMEAAANETTAPLGIELARVRDEHRLGVDPRTALGAFADRVGTPDARLFVTAVMIQRETGGNLAELLANLGSLVRERAAFRGRVAALTAEPRLSALVLALLPFGMFILLGVLNPTYVRPMLESSTGHMLLLFASAASMLGYFVMRRLGAVEL